MTHTYECDECGTENEIADAVVELCAELSDLFYKSVQARRFRWNLGDHWNVCDNCGNRSKFRFRTL